MQKKKPGLWYIPRGNDDGGICPDGLARSIHLAYSLDGKNYEAMNGNYGILFAKAVLSGEDTICPKGVRGLPGSFSAAGRFCHCGRPGTRKSEDGSADGESEGKLLYWTTADLSLKNWGCWTADRQKLWGFPAQRRHSGRKMRMVKKLPASEGFRRGLPPGNTVEVSRSLCDRAALFRSRLLPSVGVSVPERIMARNAGDVEAVRAAVMYSDGSSASKQVKWETGGIDFNRPGTYRIGGTVINEQYTFPLACGYGDPVIFPWEGRYYLLPRTITGMMWDFM